MSRDILAEWAQERFGTTPDNIAFVRVHDDGTEEVVGYLADRPKEFDAYEDMPAPTGCFCDLREGECEDCPSAAARQQDIDEDRREHIARDERA